MTDVGIFVGKIGDSSTQHPDFYSLVFGSKLCLVGADLP
jgi:hypothetical protein